MGDTLCSFLALDFVESHAQFGVVSTVFCGIPNGNVEETSAAEIMHELRNGKGGGG